MFDVLLTKHSRQCGISTQVWVCVNCRGGGESRASGVLRCVCYSDRFRHTPTLLLKAQQGEVWRSCLEFRMPLHAAWIHTNGWEPGSGQYTHTHTPSFLPHTLTMALPLHLNTHRHPYFSNTNIPDLHTTHTHKHRTLTHPY